MGAIDRCLAQSFPCHTTPQYVVGVLVFFLQVASEPVRAAVLPQHVFLGLLLYLSAIFTVRARWCGVSAALLLGCGLVHLH